MGSTYTRQSSYTDGDVIQAADTNNEFDQLLAAFASSTGHTHDGTAAEGGPITKLLGNTLTFGAATAGTDITITFDGETNDGVLKWMEDEDYFEFSDDILIASTEKLQFRDTAIYINSSTDGQLDIVADTLVQVATAAFTVDASGDITLDAGGADVVLKDDGTQYGALTNTSGNLIIKSGTTTAITFSGANVTFAGTVTIGSAEISEAELEILDGATVTTTELNIMDGDTSATSTTVADADRVVFNDAGTMKQVAVTDLAAYFDDEITAMPNLVTTAATTVGALNSGSITSGFGTIDTGSSTITTTGLISGGSLDIDDVLINGTTIGHTDDTDLITLANGVVTVAGEISVTTLDIGGTNVTSTATELNLLDGVSGLVQADFTKLAAVDSTAAELNIVDGGTSATSTTVADADRVVMNDNGTMVQVAVTDLAAYFDDEITAMPNLVTTAATTVGALNSGSITSGFGTIDTGSSNITTTGVGSFGSLDISGDIDVDGTTNLDVVDIDGAVDFASTTAHAGNATFADNAKAIFGAGSDLQIYHDGSNSYIDDAGTGNLQIRGTQVKLQKYTGENMFVGISDGSASMYYDNAQKIATTATGIDVTGEVQGDSLDIDGAADISGQVNFHSNVVLDDNNKLIIGNGSDLQIYHDGSNSFIEDTGTGNLKVIAQDFILNSQTPANMITAYQNAAVSLFYSGAAKLATTNTGIDVTGIIVSDGMSTNTSGTSNFIAGVNAGNSIASGGNYNTVVGDEAGTAITTGDQNTFLGFDAGKSVNTGIRNVVIGSTAGDALTDADYNVSVGQGALSGDTLGSKSTAIGTNTLAVQNFTTATDTYNVAVGFEAGIAVTTGTLNNLVGALAGDALTTGHSNVVMGHAALSTEDTGRKNVAIGYSALNAQNADVDNNNVAVGYNAGLSVTTGVNNTLLGDRTGDALTDADNNIAIGQGALTSDTLGSTSVAIGVQSLSQQNFTTATNTYNTAVGHNAGAAVTTGIRNTLIGGLAGDALTDADLNVAVGYGALDNDQTGSKSVSIGAFALGQQNFTTATDNYNVGVGYAAGNAITVGFHNTMIGGLAGDALTDADHNVAVGMEALSADTLGSKSTAIGYNTLAVQNFTTATDTYNTAVGYGAGIAVTTGVNNTLIGGLAGDALTTGGFNVAIGYATLSTEDAHGSNVAIGRQALENQNAGAEAYNVAIGSLTGNDITTGIQNTLIGGLAGDALTDADKNVVMGYQALTTDTLGSRSVAIGFESLKTQNFTTATDSHNTAVGNRTGALLSTGTLNTFVGSQAGDGTDDGSYNTAVGKGALSGNCGNSNTVMGYQAAIATTGAGNTCIGTEAGLALTSGGNCVLLGLDAGRTGSPGGNLTTQSNEVVVGDENITEAHIQVDWTVASDQRDKTDFTALDLGLDFVKALAPVTYKWDKRSKYGDKTADDYDLNAQTPDGTHKENWLDIGFKAQEVQALEEAAGYTTAAKKNLTVSTSGDGKQMGLQYSKFVPILVKAIQELSAKNDALEARIATLEG